MRLAIALQVSPHSGVDMETVWEAERLGFAAVWCGEAYGTDAVSPVAWVLAQTKRIMAGTWVMQMPARTRAGAANSERRMLRPRWPGLWLRPSGGPPSATSTATLIQIRPT